MKTSQQKLIKILKTQKNVFPHKISKIRIEETHISWIFLTGSYAYKFKKGVKFGGVLDFSTLQLRKKYCQKEVKLNKNLCGQMYLGVVKVIRKKDGNLKIVNLNQKGKALEYAVKMKEIPQKYRMDKLLDSKKIPQKTIEKLVKILVKFHKNTPTNNKIKKYGRLKFLQEKIDENFSTLKTLRKINPKYEKKLNSFLKNNQKLFEKRIKQHKIRDLHGDLYLKNIFVVNQKLLLYDRLEFNDALRYADVAEDVAHLSMDLDFHGRSDLRREFLSKYIKKSKDGDLKNLVYFWICFKACVRAKVSLFRAKKERGQAMKVEHAKEAKKHFRLADSYLNLI